MDSRSLLEQLTKSFSRSDLSQFFFDTGKFKRDVEDYSRYIENADFVKDLQKLGSMKFEDGRRLIVLAGELNAELTSQSGKLKQYEIAKQILKQENLDAGIFVFHDSAGHFRFSWITAQYSGTKREFSSFRRYTYFVAPESSARTFVEQIGKADFSSVEKITEAFSVEPVTSEFFREYRRIFEEAEATIKLKWTDEKKRLYTQRFFNRVMFLAFLERKGWLKFTQERPEGSHNSNTPPVQSFGTVRRDYLRALFADYHAGEKEKNANFHRSRLNALFFWGLNNPRGDERSSPEFRELSRRIGDVPYLNGGLFDQEADDEEHFFPDAVVAKILGELIYQFNFTVTESTPLDIEVAVDPEMLGRIFEELVTGRHESGSYYTPKPVVAFMCREALKGYLVGRNELLGTGRNELPSYTGRNEFRGTGDGESAEAIALFVDKNDASLIRNPMQMLDALRVVKVCDPACGSGAYLLGMLHELLEQYTALFAGHQKDAPTTYRNKLDIIQNNLYGVDLDPFAVNIARLRLWLSLIVDYEGDNPPPLPNLDFKIEPGDSLTAPDPSGGLQPDMFRQQQVKDFLSLKNEFMGLHAGSDNKKKLAKEIGELREKIKEWAHPVGRNSFRPDSGWNDSGRNGIPSNSFDWQVDFAEVFAPELAASQGTLKGKMAGLVNTTKGQMELTDAPKEGGFDIILANPPYVRADTQFKHIEDEDKRQHEIVEWQNYRKQLKDSKIYKTVHEKWDLYIPFLERAYQLLRENGQMIFIIPDAYNAAKYAGKSHEFFLQNTSIERIDFCSEIDLFDAGVNNTILHYAKIAPANGHKPIRVKRWGKRDEFESNQQQLTSDLQSLLSESLFRSNFELTNSNGSKFATLGEICYVSVGMAIHADEKKAQGSFIAEDLVSEKKDKQHPKSYVEGKDIARWAFQRIRYLEYGTERAPSMFRRPTFIELHEPQEKLMAFRMCGEKISVTYDNRKLMSNHTVILCVPWRYLNGVINKSIKKAAEYKHQNHEGDRKKRENLSKEFELKYILAIMNSSFSKSFLKKIRQSKLDIYPDEWKQLPIAPISLEEQKEFVKLVDKILGEYEKHGYPLPEKSAEKLREWEGQLDEMVSRLYE